MTEKNNQRLHQLIDEFTLKQDNMYDWMIKKWILLSLDFLAMNICNKPLSKVIKLTRSEKESMKEHNDED